MVKRKKGLTFIELIIVSALISILIAGIGVAMNLSLKSHDFLRKEVSKGDAIRSAGEYLAKHIKNSAYGIVTGGTTLNLYDPSGGLSGTYTLADKVLTFTDTGGNNQIISDNIDLAFTEFATTSGKTTEIKIDFTEPYTETLYVNCRLTPPITWAKILGDKYGKACSVQQTSDGGYITAGTTNLFVAEGKDAYLIKTNEFGENQWSRTFGGSNYNDEAYSVRQTSDGGYIIAGSTSSFGAGNWDVYLIKTDEDGWITDHGKGGGWSKTFGGSMVDAAYSVRQTSDGGYVITGWTASFGGAKVYLIKTDEDGWITDHGKGGGWSKTFGGNARNNAHSVQWTSDGGYILAGLREYRSTEFGSAQVYLIKTDEDGWIADHGKGGGWSKTFGDSGWDFAYSVQETSDGGYIIAGTTSSFGAGNRDVYLIKTDEDGWITDYGKGGGWSKTFGGSMFDAAYSVQETSDGGYIIAGTTSSFGSIGDSIYLIKTDKYGKNQWSRTFNGRNTSSIQQVSDGGYIIAASINSRPYLIKTDANGNCPQASNPTVVPDTPTAEIDPPILVPDTPTGDSSEPEREDAVPERDLGVPS